MALNWNWNQSIGEIEEKEVCEGWKLKLYIGNAELITIHEHEDGKRWQMHFFICDKDHWKNIKKDKDFNFTSNWKKIKLNTLPKRLADFLQECILRGVELEVKKYED